MDEKKKEILKELLITEEDTLERFAQLIEKSKKLFAIRQKDAAIIFERTDLTLTERSALFLVGKYFAMHLELADTDAYAVGDIADGIGSKSTSISGPLGNLVSEGLVDKEGQEYRINHYKIEPVLDSIIQKYEGLEEKPKSAKLVSKKRASNSKSSTSKSKTESSPKLDVNVVPDGIDQMASDAKISTDKLRRVFEFEDDKIHLLKKQHADKDSEETFVNSMLILAAYSYHFDRRQLPADLIRSLLREANVSVSSQMKRDMKSGERRSHVIEKGDSYKITSEGISLGLSVAAELVK